EHLLSFVAEGNSLILNAPVFTNRFGFLQGIKKEADYTINNSAFDILFRTNVFPGFSGKEFNPSFKLKHFGIARENITDDIKILASAKNNPEYPVILQHNIGLGKVILYNSFRFNEKVYRGLMFAGLTSGLSGIPYPVANVSTIFLDDFPAPLYNEK